MENEMSAANWPTAPYIVGGAVHDDRRFAGRSQLLAELRSLAEDEIREGFILSGPRRSGKSSVLERLAKILGFEMRVVKIDMLAILGADDDWAHQGSWRTGAVTLTVLQSLLDVIEHDFGVSLSGCRHRLDPLAFDIAEFRHTGLPELQSVSGGKRLVILLDEMEVAEALDPRAPAEIVSSLQPIANTRVPKPFLGLIWGRPFGIGQPHKVPNRLKDFTRRELHRFFPDEVEEALQKPLQGCYPWPEEAVGAVWELTAGHPLFVEALGAAVHSQRRIGDQTPVSAAEVRTAIEDALRYADGWEDAWSQLSSKQQILLRALAEYPDSDITTVLTATQRWGAPYNRQDFEPFIQSLVQDGLLTPSMSGLEFQVPMISRWIYRISPITILGTPEDPTTGLIANAGRCEQEGRELYESGRLNEAAALFQEALELDPKRWSAAVWLGQILLGKGQPEAAAQMLRKASPTGEVRRIRAQALTQCLERALEKHDDPKALIEELRTIDPFHREEPAAGPLVARASIDEWWQMLTTVTTAEKAREVTERLVLGPGGDFSNEALKRVRFELESKLAGGPGLDELRLPVLFAFPYLLKELEPSLSGEHGGDSDKDFRRDYSHNWERCYTAEISAIEKLAPTTDKDGFPGPALLNLLECRAAHNALGDPLLKLALSIATSDRLKVLSLADSVSARILGAVMEHLDPLEAVQRLHDAFTETALVATTADPICVWEAMKCLPFICACELHCLQRINHFSGSAVDRRELTDAIIFLFERLEADTACANVAFASAEQDEWSRLLPQFRDVAPEAIDHILTWIRSRELGDGATQQSLPTTPSRRIDQATVQEILGNAYEVGRPVPYRLHGVPPGYLWAWSVNRLGRPLLARAYRVDGGDASVQAFLIHLWENERRLLSTLGTRWEGRALPHLYVSRFEPKHGGVLILVTEFIGTQTLRDLLTSGEIARVRSTSRAALWSHLQGIIEALAALHRSGYIHRAVRPENILVDYDGHSTAGKPWLRLANFEWSVYLYSLADASTTEARFLDRYISPERLAVYRPTANASPYIGEGPSSDAFNLGLLLFECLLEPLRSEELRPIASTYAITDHIRWITALRARIVEALRNGQLWHDEFHLMMELLQDDPLRRCADVDSILETVSRLARQDSPEDLESTSPLHVVTTLEIGTKESIARYIMEDLPNVTFGDTTALRRWLEEELAGAIVRPNRRVGAPLFIEGKSLNFTVEPFQFQGTAHRHVGWLKVAKGNDAPVGQAISSVPISVSVHNYRRDLRLAPLLTAPNSWAPFFSAVDYLHEGLTTDERAFIDRINWTVELERSSWERQVLPYELVEYRPGARPGDQDIVVIRDRADPREWRADALQLPDLMAQSVDRENVWFELGTSMDPTAQFHPDRRWIQIKSGFESDQNVIQLERYHRDGVGAPPQRGWIRPHSLAGHRALYERRKRIMTEIERDPFLVRSLLTPKETFDDLNLPLERVFDPHLDSDKRALCLAIKNRQPLFVVQGPPGTGKTTLAAEVILRTLYERPSSHILIVAQAHDPLNNLLERVEKALGEWPSSVFADRRPTSVRLVSDERLDIDRYGAEATRIPRRFHPSRVASEIMEQARKWKPGVGDIGGKAYELWRHMCESQALYGVSRSLERRLVTSANLVYATTNDRRLAAMPPGSFDLVIFEETAKALPAEVLGPMRLARRWLLIGDQKQLPPFGLENIDKVLELDIERIRREHRSKRPLAADASGIDPSHILGSEVPPQDIWAEIYREMTSLLRFFEYVHRRAARVPLPPQLQANGEETAGTVQGLSGLLATQWRMHPVIGNFVSKCFYDGKIRNGSPVELSKWRRHGITTVPEVKDRAILWLNIPPAADEPLAAERPGFGGGYENEMEARVALGFIRRLFSTSHGSMKIAIMSPYRAQVSTLGNLMRDYSFPGVGDLKNSLYTVDSFQGKQADIVLVSLVRNRRFANIPRDKQVRWGLGFLESPERSTVLFSRAEKLLIVVGCLRHFKQFPDTSMQRVAEEIEILSARPQSGVGIEPGPVFLDEKHWEALRDHYARYEARVLRGKVRRMPEAIR